MKKGQVLEGIVERVAFPNKGIVSVEGEEQKVIVKNAIEGQKIRFSINKKRKGKAEGRLLEVIEKSPLQSVPISENAAVVCIREYRTKSSLRSRKRR